MLIKKKKWVLRSSLFYVLTEKGESTSYNQSFRGPWRQFQRGWGREMDRMNSEVLKKIPVIFSFWWIGLSYSGLQEFLLTKEIYGRQKTECRSRRLQSGKITKQYPLNGVFLSAFYTPCNARNTWLIEVTMSLITQT